MQGRSEQKLHVVPFSEGKVALFSGCYSKVEGIFLGELHIFSVVFTWLGFWTRFFSMLQDHVEIHTLYWPWDQGDAKFRLSIDSKITKELSVLCNVFMHMPSLTGQKF